MFPYSARSPTRSARRSAALASSELFDDAQRATLAVLCDTWIPSLGAGERQRSSDPTGFWARSASDYGIPEAVEIALLQSGMPEEQIVGLRGLLDALAAQGMGTDAPQEAREAIVHGFGEDPEASVGMDTLRGICVILYYALPDLGTGINPNWPAMGYPGPQALPKPVDQVERPIRPLVPEGESLTLEADVVIVGSGAGGGVIAGELAARGKKVCVLEMGGYYDESDFNGLELWGYQQLFLNQGPFPTAEGQVSIQAGSSLGGGTVLNWTNCLRTTDRVRGEWASEHGLEGLDGTDYDAHMDAVWERLGVNDECSDLNGPHPRLQEGCEARGLDFRAVTRNTDPATYDPVTAGYMGFGDQSGSKRSTQKTYLADAAGHGADFLVHCRVERILIEDGRAAGVEATYADPEGRTATRHRPRRDGRRRLWLDRVTGAAAALRHRWPGRRRLPAPASDQRRLRRLRRAPGPLVGAAAGRALPRLRGSRRRLRLPARVPPAHDRAVRRRDAVALRGAITRSRCSSTPAAPPSST